MIAPALGTGEWTRKEGFTSHALLDQITAHLTPFATILQTQNRLFSRYQFNIFELVTEHVGDWKGLTAQNTHKWVCGHRCCNLTVSTAIREVSPQHQNQLKAGPEHETHPQTHGVVLPPSGQMWINDCILHPPTATACVAHLNLQLPNGFWFFWALPLRALQILLALEETLLSRAQ